MANCPFKNFDECPEHNKRGGCSFWISYNTNSQSTEAQVEGCSINLTPVLLIQQINNLAVVASEIQKVSAEISAGRSENIQSAEAARKQLVALSQGYTKVVDADYSSTLKEIEGSNNGN